jgi:HK97 family phage major capsid protein
VSDVSQLIDAALYNGAGSGGAPLGVFGITGFTNAGTVAGTAIAASNLYGMVESYELSYGNGDSAVWMLHPTTAKRIRLMEDTAGQLVLEPSLAKGIPATILGIPYVVTVNAPSTALLLADRQQLAVGRAPAHVTILDQTFADYGQIGISVSARYDVKALNAAALIKLTLS